MMIDVVDELTSLFWISVNRSGRVRNLTAGMLTMNRVRQDDDGMDILLDLPSAPDTGSTFGRGMAEKFQQNAERYSRNDSNPTCMYLQKFEFVGKLLEIQWIVSQIGSLLFRISSDLKL